MKMKRHSLHHLKYLKFKNISIQQDIMKPSDDNCKACLTQKNACYNVKHKTQRKIVQIYDQL